MSTDGKDGVDGAATPAAAKAGGKGGDAVKSQDKPAAVADAQKPPAPKAAAHSPARGAGALIAVLALIVALAALGASWQAWRQSDAARAALDQTRAELEQRIGEFPRALEQVEQRVDAIAPRIETGLRHELNAFDERLAALDELLRSAATPAHEPADIEHLLLIANDSLILQRDITTALAALRAADERLHALADPAFAETRRRLAGEIAALQSLPRPDIAGAAFAISGLQQQLDELTLESVRAPGIGQEVSGSADANGADGEPAGWRAVMDDLWARLSALVVIRRGDESDGPLISPDQRVFLNQNLRLQLESARLALMSRDEDALRHHLGIARDWLVHHYDTDNARVAALLGGMDELARLDVAPDLPDISASLMALRAVLERRRGTIPADTGAASPGQDS